MLIVGKSTWLNHLLEHFTVDDEKYDVTDCFNVSSGCITHTRGIWMFPYPLYYKNDTDVQILLCDTEGLGGIITEEGESIPAEVSNEMLKRLYLIATFLSSYFIIHMNNGPSTFEVAALKEILTAVNDFKTEVGVTLPKIDVYLKDIEKLSDSDQGTILEGWGLDREIAQVLNLHPRGKYIDPCYLSNLNRVYDNSINNIKFNPGENKATNARELISIIHLLTESMSMSDYKKYFLPTIENKLRFTIDPLVSDTIEKFNKESIDYASSVDITITEEQFAKQLNSIVDKI